VHDHSFVPPSVNRAAQSTNSDTKGFAPASDGKSAAVSIDSAVLSVVRVALSTGNNRADLRNSVCSAVVLDKVLVNVIA